MNNKYKTIASKQILHYYKVFIILPLIMLFYTQPLLCQKPNSGIHLEGYYSEIDYGFFVGLGQSYTNGILLSDCVSCEFPDAVGTNLSAGLDYYYYFKEFFYIGGTLFYDYLAPKSSFVEIESVPLLEFQNELADVTFRNTADVQFHNVMAGGFVGVRLGSRFFMRAGVSAGVVMASSFVHTKELITQTVRLSNGEIVKIGINPNTGAALAGSNENSVILKNSEYPELQNPIYLDLSTGVNFQLSEYVYLFPQLQYSRALNPISNYGKDLYINKWQLKVEIIITHRKIKM